MSSLSGTRTLDYLSTWKQALTVVDFTRLTVPQSFRLKPKPVDQSTLPPSVIIHPENSLNHSSVPSWDHCRKYLQLSSLSSKADAIQYGNRGVFPISTLAFLDGVYRFLEENEENQEALQELLQWVPTFLEGEDSLLARQLLYELGSTRYHPTEILASTQLSVESTASFANERWMDTDAMQACLNGLNTKYMTSSTTFILPITVSVYAAYNDNPNDFPFEHNINIATLTDVIGVFPMTLENCKEGTDCDCEDECMDDCNCDDHCSCNKSKDGTCNHDRACACNPDHWAFFRFNLQCSEFLFGDSRPSHIPSVRIARLKSFVGRTLKRLGKLDINPEEWCTQRYKIAEKADDSGSCGPIVLNAIQQVLDPSTPVWSPDTSQQQRAQLLHLASIRKQCNIGTSPEAVGAASILLSDTCTTGVHGHVPTTSKGSTSVSSSPAAASNSLNEVDMVDDCNAFSIASQESIEASSSIVTASNSSNELNMLVEHYASSTQESSASTPPLVAATGTLLNGHASDEGDANSITTFEPIRCRDTASAVTATSSVSSVPIDFNFLGMTFPSAHEAVNTIYRYANHHQFPLYRPETSYDPSKHTKRRIEIRCGYSGTQENDKKKHDQRRARNDTVRTHNRREKRKRTDCPWRISFTPIQDSPRWKVSAFGKEGSCPQHNAHEFVLQKPNICPDLSIDGASSTEAAPHPHESQPSLTDIADLLKSVSSEYPAKKARIMIAVEKSIREIIDSATADSE